MTQPWLVACEESGAVRDALIARNIPAASCDLKPTRRPGPHIQGNVLQHIGGSWAGIIAFPDWHLSDVQCRMGIRAGAVPHEA